MEDCYKILGVSPKATASEIKSAYRKKVKALHPDMTSGISAEEKERNIAEFQKILHAYEVLSDIKQRSLFDTSYAAWSEFTYRKQHVDSFDYRTWLLERGDEESLSKLIFYDVMHNREDEAVEYFKKLNSSRFGYSLSRYFTREDFMDYGYILSEELIIRLEYYDAILLLEQIIRMEYSYTYFNLFFPDVLDLARSVLKKHIAGTISDELAIDVFERALELGFGKKDDAFFLARIAECYYRLGDVATAEICAQKAYEFDGAVYVNFGK
ncbi:MAG: J domain-containing protein [Treponemataceae bacterium]|nr:J domain-containing protein [Treponemataceae bacterium]